jgi:hypothetical protein
MDVPALMSLISRTIEDKALARTSFACVAFGELRVTLFEFQREPLMVALQHRHTQPTLIFFDRHRRQAILVRMCEDCPINAIRLPGVFGRAAEVLRGSMLWVCTTVN